MLVVSCVVNCGGWRSAHNTLTQCNKIVGFVVVAVVVGRSLPGCGDVVCGRAGAQGTPTKNTECYDG